MLNKGNLKQKAASSILWTSIQKFSIIGINFISGIILARLLFPEDYGCIGMLSIFMMVANSLIDGGFASALIQKKRPTQEDYSTIFFWNVGMSIIMYIIIWIIAPFIAVFYKITILSKVLRVQGIVLIIHSFFIIQHNQLMKQFRFKKIMIINLISSITSLVITIILAYRGFGVWALVVQNICMALMPTLIYWSSNKWFPSWIFSYNSFKELFGFGVFMFISRIINEFCNNIQGVIIGRFYNPTIMGFYSKAKTTEELASTSIANIIGQVTYPLYAEYQNDKSQLKQVIRKMTSTIAFCSFPMLLLLVQFARSIFYFLYSDKWLNSVLYFQILCFAGIAICLQSVNSQAIAAIGKSKIMFIWTIIKRSIGLILVLIGLIIGGMNGLLIGAVLQSWVIYLINGYLVGKYIGYSIKIQMMDLFPILVLTLISTLCSYGIYLFINNSDSLINILFRLLIFITVYLYGAYIFKMKSLDYVKQAIFILTKRNGNN